MRPGPDPSTKGPNRSCPVVFRPARFATVAGAGDVLMAVDRKDLAKMFRGDKAARAEGEARLAALRARVSP